MDRTGALSNVIVVDLSVVPEKPEDTVESLAMAIVARAAAGIRAMRTSDSSGDCPDIEVIEAFLRQRLFPPLQRSE